MHLLHLLEPFCAARVDRVSRISGTDGATSGVAGCLQSQSYHTQAAIVVGPRNAELRANALGVATFDTVCPIAGSERHAVALIKRVLASRTVPERIVVWSSHLDGCARRLGAPVVRPWEIPLAETDVHSESQQIDRSNRESIRARLGLSDSSVVIALADDPPTEADLWSFVTILAMMESGGIAVTGIAPRAAAQRGRGRRFLRTMGLSQGLILTDEPIWSLSDGVDLACVGPGMWAKARELGEDTPRAAKELAWARVMAAERMLQRGVPTVTMDAMAAPLVAREFLVCSGKSSAIAGKLMAMAESETLRKHVCELIGGGVPSHATWISNRVLWQVTAMPGDAEMTSLEATIHG